MQDADRRHARARGLYPRTCRTIGVHVLLQVGRPRHIARPSLTVLPFTLVLDRAEIENPRGISDEVSPKCDYLGRNLLRGVLRLLRAQLADHHAQVLLPGCLLGRGVSGAFRA
jgi:hypothetical protein